MFSRRAIQSLLDDIAEFITDKDVAELVSRLNTPRARLAATWEVAVCRGLSQIGDISYQVSLPDGSRPDIGFVFRGGGRMSFVADVTTVSDDGYHRENQVQAFANDFESVVRGVGLDPRRFHFHIESKKVGNRVRLLIPKPSDRLASLRKHLGPFFREIRSDERAKHQTVISAPDLRMTVSYDIGQRYMGFGHRMYNQARSIDQNPIWNRLENKANQLRSAETLAGVIVCDGGCSLLSGGGRDIDAFSADDIIRKFLQSSSSVGFVYTITSRRRHGLSRDYCFEGRAWASDSTVIPLLESTMAAALASLPIPIFDSKNAATQAEQRSYDFGSRASFVMESNGRNTMRIRMSARRLLEILAGKHSPLEIDAICGGPIAPAIPGQPNPFKRALDQGQLITGLQVEPITGIDDDQVTISFGPPDPAVSKFRAKHD